MCTESPLIMNCVWISSNNLMVLLLLNLLFYFNYCSIPDYCFIN